MLLRDLRAGELNLLFASVSLGVAALSSVGFLANRIEGGMQQNASALLGGDLVIASDHPTPQNFLDQARHFHLTQAQTVSFVTMARGQLNGEPTTHLVALKAVPDNYPLKGQLTLQLNPFGTTQEGKIDPVSEASSAPAPHSAFVDPEVLDALGLSLGDHVEIGDARFVISNTIASEPDKGSGFMNFAPRVLIGQNDLESTHLIQPGSRINWRLALMGSEAEITAFQSWANEEIKAQHLRGIHIETLQEGRPEMRITMDRSSEFLNLVALLCALLCAVALALAARGFVHQKTDECALLRVFGLSQKEIQSSFALEFSIVGLLASILGSAIGFAVHEVLIAVLGSLLPSDLPKPSLSPVLSAMGVGLILMFSFGWPPIVQLSKVPAMRVIRRDMGPNPLAAWVVMGMGLTGLCILLLMISQHARLVLMVLTGFAFATALFVVLSLVCLRLLKQWLIQQTPPLWLRLASQQLYSKPWQTATQVSALSLGLLALFLLILLRTDMIRSWQESTPEDAPNRFVINVMPEQTKDFLSVLDDAGVKERDWYPMIRGRLVQINGKNVSQADYSDDQARRMVERDFNLSYSETPPNYDSITQGQWVSGDTNGVSVEEGLAKTLHIKLGDELSFDIAGVTKTARVTSLRAVNWTSMRVNFFVMFPLKEMPSLPTTYISAFKAPASPRFDAKLNAQFPNITTVNMSTTLHQIQNLLNQVIAAVQALFVFALAAGMLVLFATVNLSRTQRMREHAILRALGATTELLSRVQRTELLGVGALSGFLASILAWILGALLAHYVFDFTWTPSLWVLASGTPIGATLSWAAGAWSLNQVLRQEVVKTLRQAPV